MDGLFSFDPMCLRKIYDERMEDNHKYSTLFGNPALYMWKVLHWMYLYIYLFGKMDVDRGREFRKFIKGNWK